MGNFAFQIDNKATLKPLVKDHISLQCIKSTRSHNNIWPAPLNIVVALWLYLPSVLMTSRTVRHSLVVKLEMRALKVCKWGSKGWNPQSKNQTLTHHFLDPFLSSQTNHDIFFWGLSLYPTQLSFSYPFFSPSFLYPPPPSFYIYSIYISIMVIRRFWIELEGLLRSLK